MAWDMMFCFDNKFNAPGLKVFVVDINDIKQGTLHIHMGVHQRILYKNSYYFLIET